MNKQFHWVGYVMSTDETQILKMVCGKHSVGSLCKCYKDISKANLKSCGTFFSDLEVIDQDRLF